jgi:hypothetical protein
MLMFSIIRESVVSASKQVIFIDSKVPDYQSIVAGLPSGSLCYAIDANSSGLQQMANVLSARHDLTTVHVISLNALGGLEALIVQFFP